MDAVSRSLPSSRSRSLPRPLRAKRLFKLISTTFAFVIFLAHINTSQLYISDITNPPRLPTPVEKVYGTKPEDIARFLEDPGWRKHVPLKYQSYVDFLCDFYHLPKYLFVAMISHESGWDPRSYNYNPESKTYDVGLGQLNSRNFKRFKEDFFLMRRWGSKFDPWDPYTNLQVSAAFLADRRDYLKGNILLALQAYNVGLGGLKDARLKKIGVDYMHKVLHRLEVLRRTHP